MSDDSKINVYVNSKNRRTDETASNFNIIIPDGLLKVNSDETFELNVISFNCINSFYHCNDNSNKFYKQDDFKISFIPILEISLLLKLKILIFL